MRHDAWRWPRQASVGRWLVATIAPWAMAAGLVVSFTAAAGQPAGGWSLVDVMRLPPPEAEPAPGPSLLAQASAFRLPGLDLTRLDPAEAPVVLASHSHERPRPFDPRTMTLEPREALKANLDDAAAAVFPQVDRSRKGDPLVALRRTVSTRTPSEAETRTRPTPAELGALLFSPAEDGVVSHGFSRQPFDLASIGADGGILDRFAPAGPEEEAPWELADLPEPMEPPADAFPPRAASYPPVLVEAEAAITRRIREAATRYASLVEPKTRERELRCLAEAVYFEARSEPRRGQAAVAQVVLNRARHENYPGTICGVVYQNRHKFLACQFTFACEGKPLTITEPAHWRGARQIAEAVLDGRTYLSDVGGSTHYHADYVRPYWAPRLKKMDTIGRHIFYQLRPGQT